MAQHPPKLEMNRSGLSTASPACLALPCCPAERMPQTSDWGFPNQSPPSYNFGTINEQLKKLLPHDTSDFYKYIRFLKNTIRLCKK